MNDRDPRYSLARIMRKDKPAIFCGGSLRLSSSARSMQETAHRERCRHRHLLGYQAVLAIRSGTLRALPRGPPAPRATRACSRRESPEASHRYPPSVTNREGAAEANTLVRLGLPRPTMGPPSGNDRTPGEPQIRSAPVSSIGIDALAGVIQQILQGELSRLLARQVRLPVYPRGQYRVRAAPDQPDENLRHDRGAHRPQASTLTEKLRFCEDVVPKRRALVEARVTEYLALSVARRGVPDLLWAEHGYVS